MTRAQLRCFLGECDLKKKKTISITAISWRKIPENQTVFNQNQQQRKIQQHDLNFTSTLRIQEEQF